MNEDNFESDWDIYISLQKIRICKEVLIRDLENTPTKFTKMSIPPSIVRQFKNI